MSKAGLNRTQSFAFAPSFQPEAMKKAMKEAIRVCALSREQIADRMRVYTGRPVPTRATLDAWTCPTKPNHLPRADDVEAFCVVTGSPLLLAAIAAPALLTVIDAGDAELLAIARLREQRAALDQELEKLMNARARVADHSEGRRG